MTDFFCPICLDGESRFPYNRTICENCLEFYPPVDSDMNRMHFSLDQNGNFMSIVNHVAGTEHMCFVNNLRCWADVNGSGEVFITIFSGTETSANTRVETHTPNHTPTHEPTYENVEAEENNRNYEYNQKEVESCKV